MIRRLWCRMVGHAWFPAPVTRWQEFLGSRNNYRCRRCRKWKTVEFRND